MPEPNLPARGYLNRRRCRYSSVEYRSLHPADSPVPCATSNLTASWKWHSHAAQGRGTWRIQRHRFAELPHAQHSSRRWLPGEASPGSGHTSRRPVVERAELLRELRYCRPQNPNHQDRRSSRDGAKTQIHRRAVLEEPDPHKASRGAVRGFDPAPYKARPARSALRRRPSRASQARNSS
jgi:hypothetical protein